MPPERSSDQFYGRYVTGLYWIDRLSDYPVEELVDQDRKTGNGDSDLSYPDFEFVNDV